MKCRPPSLCTALAFFGTLLLAGCGSKSETGSDDSIKGPATVEQAAHVLDLSTFPLMEGANEPQQRNVANLGYNVASTPKQAFEFQRKQLTDRKWKESRDTTFTDQTASGTFTRSGFMVSVSAYPLGDGKIAVFLHNQGNVSLSKLPRPEKTKTVYSAATAAMYVTDAPVDATKDACRKLFLAEGWQPYGSAGDTQSFKQNAIVIGATVSSAPAQGGKTMISYSTELVSAD